MVSEAIAHKRVVITTNVADLPLILGSKVFYCRKKDCVDLADKMTNVIDDYKAGSMNYDSVISMLSINPTSKEFIDLYYKE